MIYLDNAATTKPSQFAVDIFDNICKHQWANPSSRMYEPGAEAARLISEAREIVAEVIGCEPECIVFTSGATEGANMVMQGFVPRGCERESALLLSRLEHPAVYNTALYLRDAGVYLSWLSNDKYGEVTEDHVEQQLQKLSDFRRKLVCTIGANNELGTINSLRRIAEVVHDESASFLADTTQLVCDPRPLPTVADYMIFSGHKFGGLRGCGWVYYKDPTSAVPLIHGGHQERGLRAGTENVAAIYATARQFEAYRSALELAYEYLRQLNAFIRGALVALGARINGGCDTLQTIISATFPGVSANDVIARLALDGICLSAGSACSSGEDQPSRVLKAIGMSDEDARSTIRISLNASLRQDDAEHFIEKLKGALEWEESK